MSDVPQIDGEDGKVRPLAAPSSAFLQPDARSFGFAHLLGMQIVKSADGVGQVRIAVDNRLMHPQQAVHGGVIFTLADTAMSMALRSVLPPGTPFGTIEAKINYLRPVPDGELLAEGLIVHQGGSTAVMEATIYNLLADEQQVVAKALGTFYIKRAKKTNP
ncbi:MAG TPA: PaaI family thioesterase [Ktedonobacteraceae bacterium]|nr:PaaI family thioesterase [Ktedonobacteraceae bacterium]